MKILVMHRIPYYKVEYHRGIDHSAHQVTYLGTRQQLQDLPAKLICNTVVFEQATIQAEFVIQWMKKEGYHFDRIIALSEFQLLDAAKIRDAFTISGAGYVDAECVRNKLKMKDCVRSHGIASSAYSGLRECLSQPNVLGFPDEEEIRVVLKPKYGACSQSVRVFESVSALKLYAEENIADPSAYLVEVFVSGDIWHIDGLVDQGELILAVPSRYVGNCYAYAQGMPLGSVQYPMTAKLNQWVKRCLRAVRITQGSFHLEAILTEADWYFLEIANRVGGADIVKTFEYRTGVHLPSSELKLLLGESLPLSSSQVSFSGSTYYGWFVFPGHASCSVATSVEDADEFRYHPCVLEWDFQGNRYHKPESISYHSHETPLSGIVSAKASDELTGFLSQLLNVSRGVGCD